MVPGQEEAIKKITIKERIIKKNIDFKSVYYKPDHVIDVTVKQKIFWGQQAAQPPKERGPQIDVYNKKQHCRRCCNKIWP